MSATDTSKPYILGVNQPELDRLGIQHEFWSSRTSALWERAGIRAGQRVLDIACGPGFTTLELARLVGPTGKVVGIDQAEMYLEYVRHLAASTGAQNIELRHADAQNLRAALGDAPRFDAAYARWVLCFVSDPEAVVAQAASLLNPGGRLIVQDYFNYRAMSLAPKDPAFDRVIAAVDQSVRHRGGDLDVGGRLPGMMRRAGLSVREITPQLRLARPHETLWAWPDSFFKNYIPELEAMGAITPDERAEFERAWSRAGDDPDAFIYTPPLVEIIAVKA